MLGWVYLFNKQVMFGLRFPDTLTYGLTWHELNPRTWIVIPTRTVTHIFTCLSWCFFYLYFNFYVILLSSKHVIYYLRAHYHPSLFLYPLLLMFQFVCLLFHFGMSQNVVMFLKLKFINLPMFLLCPYFISKTILGF